MPTAGGRRRDRSVSSPSGSEGRRPIRRSPSPSGPSMPIGCIMSSCRPTGTQAAGGRRRCPGSRRSARRRRPGHDVVVRPVDRRSRTGCLRVDRRRSRTTTMIRPSVASSRSSRSVPREAYADMAGSPRRSAIGAPPTCCNERCRAVARSAGSATRCTTSRISSRTGRRTPSARAERGRSSGSPPRATSTKPMPRRELATRTATRDAALAAAGQTSGLLVEVDTIADRWREIEQTLDAGHDVTLLRDGRPWATISPA